LWRISAGFDVPFTYSVPIYLGVHSEKKNITESYLLANKNQKRRFISKLTAAVFVLDHRALRTPIYLPCIDSVGYKNLAPTRSQY
jgi:hypothetical protein